MFHYENHREIEKAIAIYRLVKAVDLLYSTEYETKLKEKMQNTNDISELSKKASSHHPFFASFIKKS
jgi:hypothetical protein